MEPRTGMRPAPNDHRRGRRRKGADGRSAGGGSADEMIDAVEADEADDDQVDGDDVVQQPRHEQDQNAGEEGNKRRDMGNGDGHEDLLGRVDELKNAVMVPNSSLPGLARRKTRVNALLTRQSILFTRRWMRGSSPRMTGENYPSMREKSATVRVAARISLSKLRRFSRSCLSSTLTVTLSKNASTWGRSFAMALMAASKSSRATAADASAFAVSIALASARSSSWR